MKLTSTSLAAWFEEPEGEAGEEGEEGGAPEAERGEGGGDGTKEEGWKG